ncbi:hypothetical protein [Flammeovirga sp. SubArs3]|uniref:hypothetical protein n=1 Tax=Flammeovirga sp. SubArs3 TaxID=2995316 RepID=UPI00248CE3C9|nr:hypothetical protein [Flammeovirga sp. SubArs3]
MELKSLRELSQPDYQTREDDFFTEIYREEDLKTLSDQLFSLLTITVRYQPFDTVIERIRQSLPLMGFDMPNEGQQLHRDLSLQHLRLLENVGERDVKEALNSLEELPLDDTSYYLKIIAPLILCHRVSNWETYKWVALEIVNYAFENGKSEITAFGCLALARYMITRYEDIRIAHEYAKFAITEIMKSDDDLFINNFHSDYAFTILPWIEKTDVCLQHIKDYFNYAKRSNDNFSVNRDVKRYYQLLLFNGYNKEEALKLTFSELSEGKIEMFPQVEEVLDYFQLEKITDRSNLEKVIMVIDSEPEMYEGNLLHPALLLLKAVQINNDHVQDEGSLRKILDRFKYWAGYSPDIFNVWVAFVEAEWRYFKKEYTVAQGLYDKALDFVNSNKNDLKCLIALRKLAVFYQAKDSGIDTKQLYQNTLDMYTSFGNTKAIETLKSRFQISE